MFVDMLDDLFAALVLEIDVDVGRLLALDRHEALEQKLLRPLRTDGCNAEAIANERIGGRAAALTKNSFRFGETDNVVDGQKISGAIQFFDNRQFLGQSLMDVRGNACPDTGVGLLLSSERQALHGPLHILGGIRWDSDGA